MYPFVFNPFGRNNTVNILDLVIPKVKTIAIGESTENVVLGICPKVWCRLPKEGVIVLRYATRQKHRELVYLCLFQFLVL